MFNYVIITLNYFRNRFKFEYILFTNSIFIRKHIAQIHILILYCCTFYANLFTRVIQNTIFNFLSRLLFNLILQQVNIWMKFRLFLSHSFYINILILLKAFFFTIGRIRMMIVCILLLALNIVFYPDALKSYFLHL